MCVCVADWPEVTSKSLQSLTSLPGLRVLSLSGLPANWLTDTRLQILHDISQLKQLDLGDRNSPIQMNITAAAVTRSDCTPHRQL